MNTKNSRQKQVRKGAVAARNATERESGAITDRFYRWRDSVLGTRRELRTALSRFDTGELINRNMVTYEKVISKWRVQCHHPTTSLLPGPFTKHGLSAIRISEN